ncbi:MAG: anti-sigma factor antagonist [Firmicutes bacterium]|nr:anti-sigma factor antagonist [Bacillota bacterium]
MQLKQRLHNNVLYISMDGELDHHTAEFTRVHLDDLMTQTKAAQIIIDLARLSFMDSTGIGVLIGRYKKMKAKNVPIFICNPSNQAERIFKMTGLYSIMPKIG